MYTFKHSPTVCEPAQRRAADPFKHLRPLDARLEVECIFFYANSVQEGSVIVGLFTGIGAVTEALLRAGVTDQKLVVQEEGLVIVGTVLGHRRHDGGVAQGRSQDEKAQLYGCKIDPKAWAVIKERASDWLQVFPELLHHLHWKVSTRYFCRMWFDWKFVYLRSPFWSLQTFHAKDFLVHQRKARGLIDPRTHRLVKYKGAPYHPFKIHWPSLGLVWVAH